MYFNVLLRFQHSIPYLSVFVRSEVSILTSSIDGASRGSDGKKCRCYPHGPQTA